MSKTTEQALEVATNVIKEWRRSQNIWHAAVPVAAALSGVRAPLMALADDLDREAAADCALTVEDGQFAQGIAYAADRIRRAAEQDT